jgi:hypothetical protein
MKGIPGDSLTLFTNVLQLAGENPDDEDYGMLSDDIDSEEDAAEAATEDATRQPSRYDLSIVVAPVSRQPSRYGVPTDLPPAGTQHWYLPYWLSDFVLPRHCSSLSKYPPMELSATSFTIATDGIATTATNRPPPLHVGCAVLPWMASPAREGPASVGPYPPDAMEPLLRELRGNAYHEPMCFKNRANYNHAQVASTHAHGATQAAPDLDLGISAWVVRVCASTT